MIARLFRYIFGRRPQPSQAAPVAPIASHVPLCDCMLCTNFQIRAACEYAAQHPEHCGHVVRDVLTPEGVTRVRVVFLQEPAFQRVFGQILGPVAQAGGRHES